jgi:hypothetical protein
MSALQMAPGFELTENPASVPALRISATEAQKDGSVMDRQSRASVAAVYRNKALENLTYFASLEGPTPEKWGICKAIMFLGSVLAPGGKRGINAESVAQDLHLALMDKDGDGDISEEEKEATCLAMVNETNNLLVNLSVIGALILGIVYPICFEDLTPSDPSIEYFGEEMVDWCLFLYHGLLVFMTSLSIIVVTMGVLLYKHLNFFMVTIEMKLWWLQTVSVKPLVVLAQLILLVLPISLPVGAVAKQGPTAGAISLGFGLIFWVTLTIYMYVYQNWLMAIQHDKIKFYVKKLAAKQLQSPTAAVSNLLQKPMYHKAATKLKGAKLTLDGLMDALPDFGPIFVNNLLVRSGIDSPGERLAIINALKNG